MKPNGEFCLAREWEYCCVICGRKIETYRSFSVEHLVPRSLIGKSRLRYLKTSYDRSQNLAPSHYNCNQTRGIMSIIEASKKINKYLDKLGEAKARDWLNRSNAGRNNRENTPNNLHTVIANWGNFCKIPDGSGNPKQFVL